MNKSTSFLTLFLALSLLNLSSCKKEELPTVLTSSIANITATSASSGGVISSDGGADVTARGICWNINGNPTIIDSKTNDGTGQGQFVSNLSELSVGTSYHVRAYACNSIGTAYGADMTFTTLGGKPECITQPPTNMSANGITLNGTVNANFSPASVTFEYGTKTSYGQTINAIPSPVTGNSISNVSATITGLNEGTTYHYRVKAINSIGSDEGEDMTFTTAGQAPEATTQLPTNITTVTATLNGLVNANHSSTYVTFEYGTTNAYGNSVTAVPSPVTGNTSTAVSYDITGLQPGTMYHFRLKAVSSLGTDNGDDVTFTTVGQRPNAISQQASNVQVTTATLNGTINANHLPTVYSFEYGPTTSYGSTASTASNQITGTANLNVSVNLVGLVGGTTYHYRVLATNQLGTTYGEDVAFTTSGYIPSVTTLEVTNISPTNARFNGAVNANYLSTTVSFEYGTTTNYGQTVFASQNPVTGNSTVSVSAEITGLTGNTVYYVRMYATNSVGTVYGNEISFRTPFSSCGILTDVDGNTYNTVIIGTQCWMTENLKTTKYNDNSDISNITENTIWATLTSDAYSFYENNNSYREPYGVLYNWYAVNTKKLCPAGWHVPDDNEWKILEMYLGMTQNQADAEYLRGTDEGSKLKEVGNAHWLFSDLRYPATNISGFSALPGGWRDDYGGFTSLNEECIFWTSDVTPGWNRIVRILGYGYSGIIRITSMTSRSGFSVRCLKD